MKALSLIKSCGMKAGIAINPATPVEVLIDYLHVIDYVVVMGVNPGFSGQKFFEGTTEKVSVLSEMISASETDVMIQVDRYGGGHIQWRYLPFWNVMIWLVK